MNEAAVQSARISKEAQDYYMAEIARTQPQRDAAVGQQSQVAGAQLEGMQFATQQAKDLDARNKTVFQPMEDRIVADASSYDTAGRRAQASSEATAGVEAAFGNAQQGLARELGRRNVTAGSNKSMSLMQDAALAKAKAVAGATSGAVKGVEQQGYARTMDAAALGKGTIGNQATQQQIAQSGGAQAAASSGAALSSATSGAALAGAGFSTALQGQGQAGSLYGQAANIKAQSSGDMMEGIGGLASLGTKLYMSDKTRKKGTGKPVDGKQALAGIEATPVDAGWQYDAAKGGVADGGQLHDGPMAQEVRKNMGNKVAPGGKQIDLVSMNGQLMAGMQELAKRMSKIERRVAA
jgi:hypothetical protein